MQLESSQDFIQNSSIGIHCVAANGIIEYANACELETLGYKKDEYIGQHCKSFQVDKEVLADMLERLGRFEPLINYPARVQGKHKVHYLLYNSNVYEEDGEFIHTRCFATEIERVVYDLFVKTSPYFQNA